MEGGVASIVQNLFDIERARKETLACEELIHFNNTGASLMPIPVSEAVHDYLSCEERIGGYETETKYAESLQRVYSSAASLLTKYA